MYTNAITFQLRPGCYDAYKKAHDELWPELVEAFRENEVCDADDQAIVEPLEQAFVFGWFATG
ncbi:MAG: L-rhamnose mutarotase [Candidatus Latescibacteria bacterium]|jgi:L-rhamnose mutarotase|nr:hypothetical protein [Gemmatimonadaceae bacterium]MDP6015421.1 L-rhamnose mutarotase [Candidatus Latescibacterota bacterium]MDP7450454.1 L-rhamnose mutarotase [Candidatus Latescibacterota bacterium]HJP32582.1 L-rhamnose mutarotase [Candidatus Latescibacterota bacterium]